MQPRDRVLTALAHHQPDRNPVDFLATPEIWARLAEHLHIDPVELTDTQFFDPQWEAILRALQVDCRVVSYDQFCAPPEKALKPAAKQEWWKALSRSTPSRMWRQYTPDGVYYDIWGHQIAIVSNASGAYEQFTVFPLQNAESVEELHNHPWPEPDWFDFTPLRGVIQQINQERQHHIRFRIGSVFEIAWQLRGMQEFLVDLATDPDLPCYIMDRLTEVYVENTRRALTLAGDSIDMVYFYDDVATQQSLMISQTMWRKYIKPYHARLIEVAQAFNKPVMYHCDGAIAPLIPELLDMGVNVLNPVQADAKGMEPATLKSQYGDRLSFHGGIDIIETLPRGTVEKVVAEVRERVRVLGNQGGYILASSHHIQSDTPLANVLAMYDLENRRHIESN
ncbi:MAG: hypothetical protein KF716_23120 [Anaerolineae bacterium]|nr:hypothetical protein [Anaerolineae bacterium]